MRIFILDTDEQSVTNLRNYLAELDYQTEIFHQPEEMLDAYRQERPGMVFIRVGGAKINGLQITKQVRQIDSLAKVVFVSKYKDYANFAWEVGATDYLLEPVVYERFMEALARAG